MSVPAPHFLLFSEARRGQTCGDAGQWRFVLEAVDGSTKLAAADAEPQAHGGRLDLLAVVRGLEALDQPSRVTLVTSSRYVSRGIRFGLDEWRRNGWRWERYGRMAPVKNQDLWRRVDRALRYHRVECRTWRLDDSDDGSAAAPPPPVERASEQAAGAASGPMRRCAKLCGRLVRKLTAPTLKGLRRAPEGRAGRSAWAAAG